MCKIDIEVLLNPLLEIIELSTEDYTGDYLNIHNK